MQNYEKTFQDSYRRAVGTGSYNQAFITRFHDLLIERSGAIASMFRQIDISAQRTMLHDSLNLLVDFFHDRRVTPQIEQIALLYSRVQKKVAQDLYATLVDALVDTVKEFDPEFNEEVGMAWRLVLAPGITFLQLRC